MTRPGESVGFFYIQRRRVRRFQNNPDIVPTFIVGGGNIERAGYPIHVGLGPQCGTEFILKSSIVNGRER